MRTASPLSLEASNKGHPSEEIVSMGRGLLLITMPLNVPPDAKIL